MSKMKRYFCFLITRQFLLLDKLLQKAVTWIVTWVLTFNFLQFLQEHILWHWWHQLLTVSFCTFIWESCQDSNTLKSYNRQKGGVFSKWIWWDLQTAGLRFYSQKIQVIWSCCNWKTKIGSYHSSFLK